MALTLRVIGPKLDALGPDSSKTFDQQGGSIGRALGNDWTLPDPERIISAHHALIQCDNGMFYLEDTSTNGVYLNDADEPLGQGQRVKLSHGDRVFIGQYELAVMLGAPVAIPETANDTQPPGADSKPVRSLASGGARAAAVAEEPSAAETPDAASEAVEYPGVSRETESVPPAYVDTGSEEKVAAAAVQAAARPAAEPAAAPAAEPVVPAAAVRPAVRYEWASRPRDPVAGASAPTPDAPEEALEEAPEAVEEAGAGKGPAAPASVSAPGPADVLALRALLEGAQLAASKVPPGSAPELMRVVGKILRETVKGMMEVQAARSTLQSELKVTVTNIRPGQNNPLEFSLGVDDALTTLLFKKTTGFLPPVEAIREGFEEIKADQGAVVAGMRACLAGLLERFEPEVLRRDFDASLEGETLLSLRRKATYWDKFCELYEQLEGDPEPIFRRLFEEKFAQAYEEHVKARDPGD